MAVFCVIWGHFPFLELPPCTEDYEDYYDIASNFGRTANIPGVNCKNVSKLPIQSTTTLSPNPEPRAPPPPISEPRGT